MNAFSRLEDRAEDASSVLLVNSTGTGPAMSSPSKREALMGHSRNCTVIAVSLDRCSLGYGVFSTKGMDLHLVRAQPRTV